jgi:hypothetical protein
MDKIRVGFVGAGMIGPIHMENLSRIPFIEILFSGFPRI